MPACHTAWCELRNFCAVYFLVYTDQVASGDFRIPLSLSPPWSKSMQPWSISRKHKVHSSSEGFSQLGRSLSLKWQCLLSNKPTRLSGIVAVQVLVYFKLYPLDLPAFKAVVCPRVSCRFVSNYFILFGNDRSF
jgi:hypothetical protein